MIRDTVLLRTIGACGKLLTLRKAEYERLANGGRQAPVNFPRDGRPTRSP
jgi:hypothetical protein